MPPENDCTKTAEQRSSRREKRKEKLVCDPVGSRFEDIRPANAVAQV